MRDLGYSLETAIADLIDNSISADATKIDVFCDLASGDPTVAIIDNGKGMNAEEVLAAMRHGSTNPTRKRDPSDLGRFGLGLKTASFSQCRRFTVISAQKGELNAAEWNLDLVDEKDDWLVSVLDTGDIESLPFVDRLDSEGSIVLWRHLDRLFEGATGEKRDEIVNEKLDILDKHLSLVFHRFLAGEVRGRKRLSISINGHSIEAFDPFCRKNAATQTLPEEIVRVDEVEVKMQPYILPHYAKLSAMEYDHYQKRSDFISNQGAYVYRNGRLMAWGDWFRLVPKGEATKLARVQIDFPNSLDESWTIDVKKSRANPPHPVRERLRQVIFRITDKSTAVTKGKGMKLFDEISVPVWERYADHGNIRYSINRAHPVVQSLLSVQPDNDSERLEMLLDIASSSLPVEMIYSDLSTQPHDVHQSQVNENTVIDRLKMLKDILFQDNEIDVDAFREVVRSTRFFDDHVEVTEKFICEELS